MEVKDLLAAAAKAFVETNPATAGLLPLALQGCLPETDLDDDPSYLPECYKDGIVKTERPVMLENGAKSPVLIVGPKVPDATLATCGARMKADFDACASEHDVDSVEHGRCRFLATEEVDRCLSGEPKIVIIPDRGWFSSSPYLSKGYLADSHEPTPERVFDVKEEMMTLGEKKTATILCPDEARPPAGWHVCGSAGPLVLHCETRYPQ